MLISPAHAQAAGGGGGMESFLAGPIPMMIIIFAIMYFLLIRPQQKRAKEHRAMLEALRRGDQVVTGGGMLGKVHKVKEDDEVEVEVAEGVRIRVLKSTITAVLSKTEPASDAEK